MTKSLNRIIRVLLPAAVLPAPVSSQWYRFQAAAWELSTDTGDRRGTALLRQTVEAAALLEQVAPELAPAPGAAIGPPRIVLFRSGRDFAPFRRGPGHAGLLVWSGGSALMLLLDSGEDTVRAARHELVHWMLRRRRAAPPRWLEEGLADYYSTLVFDGRAVRLGRAPRGHAGLLRSRAWLGAGEMQRVGRNEQEPAGGIPELFYPQSWALVRWMMVEGGGPERVAAWMARIEEGRSQEAAFQDLYGVSMNDALGRARQLMDHLAEDAAPDARPATVPTPLTSVARRPMPSPEPDILRVECLLAAGLENEAGRLAAGIVERHPSSGAAHTMAGMLALRRQDYAAARASLERAIALGDDSARLHFEYAMLVRDTGGPEALVEQSLRRAVAVEPGFAEAWLVLGNWLLGHGRPAEAAQALERAVALEPQRSVAWEALGRAWLEAGDRARAREAASRAALSASTPEQAEMARALIREIETRPAQRPQSRPPVETPAGWRPREGDAQVSGRLVEIDCSGPRLRFRIEVRPRTARTPAQSVILETDKPNLVMLRGKTEGRREFVCGPQQPAPDVTAGYIAAPQPPAEPAKTDPQAAPPKTAAPKSAKKAPARKAPAKKAPVGPRPEPAAGELVWLEFR